MADDHPSRAPRFPMRDFGFLAPAIAWAIYFVAIYAVQGAGCAAGLQRVELIGTDLLRLIIAGLLLLTAVVIGCIAVSAHLVLRRTSGETEPAENPRRFLAVLTRLTAVVFLVATVWVGFSVALMDPCQGRLPWS